jgi:hypothetical protein
LPERVCGDDPSIELDIRLPRLELEGEALRWARHPMGACGGVSCRLRHPMGACVSIRPSWASGISSEEGRVVGGQGGRNRIQRFRAGIGPSQC